MGKASAGEKVSDWIPKRVCVLRLILVYTIENWLVVLAFILDLAHDSPYYYLTTFLSTLWQFVEATNSDYCFLFDSVVELLCVVNGEPLVVQIFQFCLVGDWKWATKYIGWAKLIIAYQFTHQAMTFREELRDFSGFLRTGPRTRTKVDDLVLWLLVFFNHLLKFCEL